MTGLGDSRWAPWRYKKREKRGTKLRGKLFDCCLYTPATDSESSAINHLLPGNKRRRQGQRKDRKRGVKFSPLTKHGGIAYGISWYQTDEASMTTFSSSNLVERHAVRKLTVRALILDTRLFCVIWLIKSYSEVKVPYELSKKSFRNEQLGCERTRSKRFKGSRNGRIEIIHKLSVFQTHFLVHTIFFHVGSQQSFVFVFRSNIIGSFGFAVACSRAI